MTDRELLEKAAQQALWALNAMTEEFRALDLPYGSRAYAEGCVAITALRAARGQPEPVHRTMIEDFIMSLANEAIRTPEKSIHDLLMAIGYVREAQPEPEPLKPDWGHVKALEELLRERMVEIHHLRALTQPEIIPGATPMAEYAAKSAAVPGRAAALKQARYTRHPWPTPEEDEKGPVAWRYPAGDEYLLTDASSNGSGWQPLYTHPPQRQPRTVEEIIRLAEQQDWDFWRRAMIDSARAIERAHGIGIGGAE